MAEAEKSGFFNWFNLAETARPPALDEDRFSSDGPKFHDLALVQAIVDANSSIVAIDLGLKRKFVQRPTNGIFARDMAKSFVLDAPPRSQDEGYLHRLPDRIQYNATSSQTVNRWPRLQAAKATRAADCRLSNLQPHARSGAEEIRALHLRDRKWARRRG